MVKKLLKKHLPHTDTVKAHKYLKMFGNLLHNHDLWHFRRTSPANAVSVGLFCALMPMPFQMILAALLAISFGVNLPISVLLVWLTNPFTIPPVFAFTYWVGTKLLEIPMISFNIELSWEWISTQFSQIWQPLLFGSVVCGLIAAILGNILVRIIWRISVARRWKLRIHGRNNRK